MWIFLSIFHFNYFLTFPWWKRSQEREEIFYFWLFLIIPHWLLTLCSNTANLNFRLHITSSKSTFAVLLNTVHFFLLSWLLHKAAHWSHDTRQTFHLIIQLPISPSQKGMHIIESVPTTGMSCFSKGHQPNRLFNFIKEKVVNLCIRTQYIPSCFHLSPLFLTHWASDPLDRSVIAKITQQSPSWSYSAHYWVTMSS